MMGETATSAKIRIAAPKYGVRLFRNQVGRYFIPNKKGKVHFINGQKVKGRWITYGMGVGSPDLIGWKTVKITPDMVGQWVAVFTGVEVKSAGGKPTNLQAAWIQAIKTAGGIAGVAWSVEDAEKIMEDFSR